MLYDAGMTLGAADRVWSSRGRRCVGVGGGVDLLQLRDGAQAALRDARAPAHNDALQARQRLQQERAEAAVRHVRAPADGEVLQTCSIRNGTESGL